MRETYFEDRAPGRWGARAISAVEALGSGGTSTSICIEDAGDSAGDDIFSNVRAGVEGVPAAGTTRNVTDQGAAELCTCLHLRK